MFTPTTFEDLEKALDAGTITTCDYHQLMFLVYLICEAEKNEYYSKYYISSNVIRNTIVIKGEDIESKDYTKKWYAVSEFKIGDDTYEAVITHHQRGFRQREIPDREKFCATHKRSEWFTIDMARYYQIVYYKNGELLPAEKKGFRVWEYRGKTVQEAMRKMYNKLNTEV
jgi:hypothetical protein